MNNNGYAYMVTDGEYSDYHVICVGDDRDKLQNFADEHGFQVEDVPTLTGENEVVPKFHVVSIIDSLGMIKGIRQDSKDANEFMNAKTPMQYSFCYLNASRSEAYANSVRIDITGVDLGRIVKCASEKSAKVAQMIVDGMAPEQVVDLMNKKDAVNEA
jgi:hypothetical protein